MKRFISDQKDVTKVTHIFTRKFAAWIADTTREIMEESFPGVKYWKSSNPKISEWSIHIVEQIVVVILRSVKYQKDELQLDVLHIVINEVCQTILEYLLKTNYRYSVTAGHKLRDHIQ